MEQGGKGVDPRDRRRRPRVALHGEVRGKIHTVAAAPVIDISEAGALIEAPCWLRPGSLYALTLPLGPGDELAVKARVVRSAVHGLERKAAGESAVRYRVALEFSDLSERDRDRLARRTGLPAGGGLRDAGGSFEEEFE